MTWLTPILIINLSIFPIYIENNTQMPDNMVQANITVGFELFNLVSVEGETDISMVPIFIGTSLFSPFQADFYFRAYIEKSGFTIGYEHLCRHPVEPGAFQYPHYYGGHDRIYLEYRYLPK